AEVMRALAALVGEPVKPEHAHEVALQSLKRHRQDLAIADRLPEIEQELSDARRLGDRQTKVREQAASLGVAPAGRPAGEVLAQLLHEAEEEVKGHEMTARAAETEAAASERDLKELEAHRRDLTAREPEWQS